MRKSNFEHEIPVLSFKEPADEQLKKFLIRKLTFELENLFWFFKGPVDERQNGSKNYLDGIFSDCFGPDPW